MRNKLPKRTPDAVDEISLRFAEETVQAWRGLRDSPNRDKYKEDLKVAFGKAIVEAIAVVTDEEMGTNFMGRRK